MTIISAASPGQLVLDPTDSFRLSNSATTPHDIDPENKDRLGRPIKLSNTFIYTWARRKYTLPPGGEITVPWDIVRVNFGDPRSVPDTFQRYEDKNGVKGDIPPRQKEIARLAVLYGLYAGNEAEIPECHGVRYITVRTIDGFEVFTPAVDPQGLNLYGHLEGDKEVQDPATMMAVMKAQLDRQAAQIEALSRSNPELIDDVGKDGPRYP